MPQFLQLFYTSLRLRAHPSGQGVGTLMEPLEKAEVGLRENGNASAYHPQGEGLALIDRLMNDCALGPSGREQHLIQAVPTGVVVSAR